MVSSVLGTFGVATSLFSLLIVGDPVALVILIGGVALLSGTFIVPFVWWSIHQRRDLVLAPIEVVADASGLSVATATTTGRHDWSVFRRVRETSGAFLFDTGAGTAILLSKRGVAEADLTRLRLLLVRSGTLDFPQGGDWSRRITGVVIGLGLTAVVIALPILLGP